MPIEHEKTNHERELSELATLQKEWRDQITNSLKELREQNSDISDTLREMRESFAKEAEFKELKKKVESLSEERNRVIGGMIVLQLIGTIFLWIFTKK